MPTLNHKAVRRAILTLLYRAYFDDPLRMVEPEAFQEDPNIAWESLVPNMHYLTDRKLVEMMMGYQPPMFTSVRITPAGVDLVENRFEFDRQFPKRGLEQNELGAVPMLLERLVEEGDFVPVDGVARRQILGDILYLREELSRPVSRWRGELVEAIMNAIEGTAGDHTFPALAKLREAVSSAKAHRDS